MPSLKGTRNHAVDAIPAEYFVYWAFAVASQLCTPAALGVAAVLVSAAPVAKRTFAPGSKQFAQCCNAAAVFGLSTASQSTDPADSSAQLTQRRPSLASRKRRASTLPAVAVKVEDSEPASSQATAAAAAGTLAALQSARGHAAAPAQLHQHSSSGPADPPSWSPDPDEEAGAESLAWLRASAQSWPCSPALEPRSKYPPSSVAPTEHSGSSQADPDYQLSAASDDSESQPAATDAEGDQQSSSVHESDEDWQAPSRPARHKRPQAKRSSIHATTARQRLASRRPVLPPCIPLGKDGSLLRGYWRHDGGWQVRLIIGMSCLLPSISIFV